MVDQDIAAFYELGLENERLVGDGSPRLEFVRTMEILDRFLPVAPATVADIGGGTGVYAAELASLGYDVLLVDPIEGHVVQAAERVKPWSRSSVQLGDARLLAFSDSSVDACLMAGPLYHLLAAEDRKAAWSEAVRVVRPGGLVLGVGISRFASLLSGIKMNMVLDDVFGPMIENDLANGQHRNPDVAGRPEFFTSAYFHHPDDLRAEAEGSGLSKVQIMAIEGPGYLVESAEGLEGQLEAARLVESEPSLLGASPHIVAIGIVT